MIDLLLMETVRKMALMVKKGDVCDDNILWWSTADSDITIPCAENRKLSDVLFLKPGERQNIASHAPRTLHAIIFSSAFADNLLLERRTFDRKVSNSNPGRSGGGDFLLQS